MGYRSKYAGQVIEYILDNSLLKTPLALSPEELEQVRLNIGIVSLEIDPEGLVTVEGDLEVLGIKDFRKGLKIDGILIEKSLEDTIFIDGNVVIKGGLAVYGLKELVIEALDFPIASTATPGIALFSSEDFIVNSSGLVTLANKSGGLDEEELYEYLTLNKYVTQDYLEGYLTEETLQAALELKADKSYVDATFVTFNIEEDINASKNFLAGLKILGAEIRRYEDVEDTIYIDANLVVRGGLTFFAVDSVTIPSISDYIGPATNTVLGVASFDKNYFIVSNGHVTMIPDSMGLNEEELLEALRSNGYMTANLISQEYVNITTFSELSTTVGEVYDTLYDFLQGSDTDDIINKWKELEAFLSGLSETDNLVEILATKADLEYVNSSFVTIAGNEDVTGIHNFVNGMSIGNIPIYRLLEDVLYIEGNLAVRGGLTIYALDDVTIEGLLEALPLASTTTLGVAKFVPSQFYIDSDGFVNLIDGSGGIDTEELKRYLVSNGYTTLQWVTDLAYLLSIDSAMVIAALGYTPFNNASFTKDNIQTTLGISDWALATSKPSYNTSEVTEGSNLYFTNQRAIDALLATLQSYATLVYVNTELAKYVSILGDTNIYGIKNFLGTLLVNGSPIVYNSEEGYWKLQGNLLITGGISMYYDDGTIDLPTIYDGLPVDGTTIYWENGVLKAVKGGGVADSVAWGDITGVPSWITTSKPSYSYSEITGTPDLSVYATTAALTSGLNTKANKATTLSGYGITDAKISNGVITLGSNTITPLTAHQTIYALTIQKNGTSVGSYTPNSAAKTINITVPTKVSELTNDSSYATTTALTSGLNEKANSSVKISAGTGLTGGGNLTTDRTLSLSTSGVSAGTYRSVTVDTYGRVTAGSNPTTLSGYGITDAKISNGVITLGSNTITPLTTHQTIYNLTLQAGTFSAKTFDPNGAALTVNIPTTTNHISEGSNLYFTNARAVSALTNTLANYVTLAGTQTITGSKNFTGGLKVNGGTIYYNSSDGYWKLEGDLLVTGGVSMYANDSGYTPSTIMDAISVDGTTISKANGYLEVIGGGSGVSSWEELSDIPSYLGDTGLTNTLTIKQDGTTLGTFNGSSSVTVNITGGSGGTTTNPLTLQANGTTIGTFDGSSAVTANFNYSNLGLDSRYLKLSGGTINGYLTINVNDTYPLTLKGAENYSVIHFRNKDSAHKTDIGWLNDDRGNFAYIANISSPSVLCVNSSGCYYSDNVNSFSKYPILHSGNYTSYAPSVTGSGASGTWGISITGSSASCTGNAATATKLATARTIWGQSFNGTGNVDGVLSNVHGIIMNNTSGGKYGFIDFHYNGASSLTSNIYEESSGQLIINHELVVNNYGNVGIGTTSPSYKLHVNGSFYASSGSFGGNAASATKLQTARTIWGQSFNGTDNITGTLKIGDYDIIPSTYGIKFYGSYPSLSIQNNNDYNSQIEFLDKEGAFRWSLSYRGLNGANKDLYLYRSTDGTNADVTMSFINSSGNVGIGTTSPSYALDVNGTFNCNSISTGGNSNISKLNVNRVYATIDYIHLYVTGGTNNARPLVLQNGYGNVGIGTASPSYTLDINGNSRIGTYLTFGDHTWGTNTGYGRIGSFDFPYSVTVNIGGYNTTSSDKTHCFRIVNNAWNLDLFHVGNSGNVGIGTETPETKLHVVGNILATDGITLYNNTNTSPCIYFQRGAAGDMYTDFKIHAEAGTLIFTKISSYGPGVVFTFNEYGNFVANGGITMYSDIRKKTKLQDVELSLKQIADAPLIEHYYNTDLVKTTHVGSIAQYWAGLNDWFCKLDNEGYYTMEIQNAALASAISIARELERYESKTDKQIKKLKKRICELEEQVEQLKAS